MCHEKTKKIFERGGKKSKDQAGFEPMTTAPAPVRSANPWLAPL